jgi:endonuclease/exonuclease/phosphatase family metal-dependent hydrolase
MPYVFGANSNDGLWGNAILNRASMTAVDIHHFITTQNLRRGVIQARVSTQMGPVWVFGTHLDNPRGAEQVRLAQVTQMLDFTRDHRPAVIMGELNADPDDPVLRRLSDAGFSDTERSLDPETFTSDNHRRIDYILVSPGVGAGDVQVPKSAARDHRLVVATLRVR